ncbi:MAG: hypothetical protein ACRC9S_08965 [Vibrio sp.]
MVENNKSYVVLFRIDHFSSNLFDKTIDELERNLVQFKYLNSEVRLLTRNKAVLGKQYAEYDVSDVTIYSSVIIKDAHGVIKCSIYNDAFMPFNFDEIFRMLHAIRTTEITGELCPANWHPNKTTIRENISDTINYLLKEL